MRKVANSEVFDLGDETFLELVYSDDGAREEARFWSKNPILSSSRDRPLVSVTNALEYESAMEQLDAEAAAFDRIRDAMKNLLENPGTWGEWDMETPFYPNPDTQDVGGEGFASEAG